MTNGNIPDLGQIRRSPEQPRASTGMFALVRALDENGTYVPAQVVRTPQGIQVIPHRTDVVDAEQLVEMMRTMVRQELRAFAVRMKMPIPDEE